MDLLIESTPTITYLDGVPCRVWRGVDAQGRRCDVFVHRVGTEDAELQKVLADELREVAPPAGVDVGRAAL